MVVAVERIAPVPTKDGGKRYFLSPDQETQLKNAMRRYWHWIASGRREDPWLASGAARGIDYARPHVKHHKPSGGYGPGESSPLDDDDELARADTFVARQCLSRRLLLYWRYREQASVETIIARMHLSEKEYANQMRTLRCEAFDALFGA